MLQRAFDWFWGLNLAQKVLAVLFAALLLFSVSYLVSTAVLRLMGAGGERGATPSGQGEASQATPFPAPHIDVSISSARWEGEKAVVEGTWKGDISSVHCDLMQGGGQGRATDWWDRGLPARMSWSQQTFTQSFIEAKGRKIEDPIDSTSNYAVVCLGQFSEGWQISDSAGVEGTPPG